MTTMTSIWNTESDIAIAVPYPVDVPENYWDRYSSGQNSEYKDIAINAKNAESLNNIYLAFRQYLNSSFNFLKDYSFINYKNLNIINYLLETSIELFPNYRSRTKEEIMMEKKYKIEHSEIISI